MVMTNARIAVEKVSDYETCLARQECVHLHYDAYRSGLGGLDVWNVRMLGL